jgi:hypothetical protein
LEIGNWKLEIGNWKLEIGDWKLEIFFDKLKLVPFAKLCALRVFAVEKVFEFEESLLP